MWSATEHSTDENVRWSWLRAVEWIGWPLFLSQPIVPVLLYFFPWYWICGAVIAVTIVWRAAVVPFLVAPRLADIGPPFVTCKFITAPLMAYFLWRRGDTAIALIAFLWPFLGVILAQWLMAIPIALLNLTALGNGSAIGRVQTRFLSAIGLERASE